MILAALGVGGSAAAQDGAGGPSVALARVEALIGSAACLTDADCRTLPLGTRACGGPERFVAWSARQSDGKALADAARGYATEAAPSLPGRDASTCEVLVDPGATCRRDASRPGADGRCTLRPARGPDR